MCHWFSIADGRVFLWSWWWEDFRERFDDARLLFLFIHLFIYKWRLAGAHLFLPYLGQEQCTAAQRAEMTVAERFLTCCVWACFPDSSHTVPGQHSQSTQISLGLVFYVPLRYHWVKRTPNKSRHNRVSTPEKKIRLPLPAGNRTRNLSITSPAL